MSKSIFSFAEKRLREEFPYRDLRFNPNNDAIKDVYEEVLRIRDQTVEFLKNNQDLIAESAIAVETVNRLRNNRDREEDDFRIYKSLEFFYQNLQEKKVGDIWITNHPPVGPKNGMNACEVVSCNWRRSYGDEIEFNEESAGQVAEGQKEVKTIIFKEGNSVNSKFRVVIGCGEEHLIEGKKTKMIDSDSSIIPFTINPATVGLMNVAVDSVNITAELVAAKTVTNNLGSKLLSCVAVGEDYLALVKSHFGEIVTGIPSVSINPQGIEALNLVLRGDHKFKI